MSNMASQKKNIANIEYRVLCCINRLFIAKNGVSNTVLFKHLDMYTF